MEPSLGNVLDSHLFCVHALLPSQIIEASEKAPILTSQPALKVSRTNSQSPPTSRIFGCELLYEREPPRDSSTREESITVQHFDDHVDVIYSPE